MRNISIFSEHVFSIFGVTIMTGPIEYYSLSLQDFIYLSPEDTKMNWVYYVDSYAWHLLCTYRAIGGEAMWELTTEERLMFVCFVILAEGESL